MTRNPSPEPAPDWQIDLHGCSIEQALRKLRAAVQDCRYQRYRHLRVITGRGRRSPDRESVLTPVLLDWLGGEEAKLMGTRRATLVSKGGAIDVEVDSQGG